MDKNRTPSRICQTSCRSDRWTLRGTHQGELGDIPATGKQVTQSGMSIFRLDNARIVEVWVLADNMSLMQQLGVIPVPEAIG